MWKEEVVPYVVRVLRLRSVVSESHLFGRGGVCYDDRSFTSVRKVTYKLT